MTLTREAWTSEKSMGFGARRWAWELRTLALFTLAVVYPFHAEVEVSFGVVNTSLGDALIAVALTGYLVGLIRHFDAPRYLKPAFLFLVIAALSLLYPVFRPETAVISFDPMVGLFAMAKFAAGAGWMVAMYAFLRRDPFAGIGAFSKVSVIVGTVFAAWTVSMSLAQPGTRPGGPFANENLYANYLALNLFLATMLVRLEETRPSRPRFRVPLWLSAPVLLVGMLATGSRGALIGIAVTYPWTLRWHTPGRSSVRQALAILFTLTLSSVALVTFWRANPFIAERVSGLLSHEGPNIESRLDLWGAALEAFLTAPLLGIGYGQFPQYAESVRGMEPTVVHNTFLSVAAELGVVGLAALVWLFLIIIRDGLRQSPRHEATVARYAALFICATLVQGFFANVEHYRSLWIVTGMLAAMAVLDLRKSARQAAVQ